MWYLFVTKVFCLIIIAFNSNKNFIFKVLKKLAR